MNIINAIILGIVEGATEFLPISSTAHLIIASRLLNITQNDFQKFFEVFIQSGAILAVVVIYLKTILKNKKMLINIFVAFVPTAAIGFILYKIIKTVFFNSNNLMIGAFVIVGLGFLVIEYLIKSQKIKLKLSINQLNYSKALLIGLMQALAVVPGVSRAGIVLITMMAMGFRREDAALFSFFLAVPTILAASGYDLFKSRDLVVLSSTNIIFLVIGLLTAFISSYIVINWFIKYLQKRTLTVFAIYRIIIALLLFMV